MAELEEREYEDEQDEVDEEELERYALEDIQDRFFEPWDDSDLILVVEKRKIHVHRLILTMASPVFKQMLNGNFVESSMQEIPLPGKNAYQFLCFLRQIYPQYKDGINEFNCDSLYKLADEYQVENLKESCLEVIKTVKLEKDNVFQVLRDSKLFKNKEVYKKCIKAAQELTVKDILHMQSCQPLENEDLLSLLTIKAKKLENCIKMVMPEFVGILDLALFFWFEKGEESYPPPRCPAHYMHGKACKDATIQERVQCKACKMTFKTMQYSLMVDTGHDDFGYSYSDSGVYFNDIISSLKEMYDLLHSDVTRSAQ